MSPTAARVLAALPNDSDAIAQSTGLSKAEVDRHLFMLWRESYASKPLSNGVVHRTVVGDKALGQDPAPQDPEGFSLERAGKDPVEGALKWLARHHRAYAGQWVAFSMGHLIAHSAVLKEVTDIIRQLNLAPESVLVVRLPPYGEEKA